MIFYLTTGTHIIESVFAHVSGSEWFIVRENYGIILGVSFLTSLLQPFLVISESCCESPENYNIVTYKWSTGIYRNVIMYKFSFDEYVSVVND